MKYILPRMEFELTTLAVIGTDCTIEKGDRIIVVK